MKLTVWEKMIVLGGIGAAAIAAVATQVLTGIPAYMTGAALAVPAMFILRGMKKT
jgi:hypothetical protein